MAKEKPKKGTFIGKSTDIEEEAVMVPRDKKSRVRGPTPEYTRGIRKIASYSGITRTMVMKDKNGRFDEIVNIYVYPDGIVTDYDNKVIDQFNDEHSISKQKVRDGGNMDKSIWGRKEMELGYKPPVASARHKKGSRPVKRAIKHKSNKRK